MIPDEIPHFRTREELGCISGIFYLPRPLPSKAPPQKYNPAFDILLGTVAGLLIAVVWWLTQ